MLAWRSPAVNGERVEHLFDGGDDGETLVVVGAA
jgi:hypothetical protein